MNCCISDIRVKNFPVHKFNNYFRIFAQKERKRFLGKLEMTKAMTIEYPAEYWKDYELIDSGYGEKLERFGKYVLRRPEPKALLAPSLTEGEWKRQSHVVFRPGAGFGKAG